MIPTVNRTFVGAFFIALTLVCLSPTLIWFALDEQRQTINPLHVVFFASLMLAALCAPIFLSLASLYSLRMTHTGIDFVSVRAGLPPVKRMHMLWKDVRSVDANALSFRVHWDSRVSAILPIYAIKPSSSNKIADFLKSVLPSQNDKSDSSFD